MFRTIHTIKGTCGFLGFHRLEALTHAGENLLGALRAGELALDAASRRRCSRLVDAVRAVLGRIEATGAEGDDDHAAPRRRARPGTCPWPRRRRPRRPAPPSDRRARAADQPRPPRAETSVRVDVAVLDKLMDLVGELVLARGQIGELAADDDDGPLAAPYRELRLVTGELQDSVMQARLQPIGTVTGKFRRIARDLGAALGKQVRVELEGEDVGVDKAVNEALRDPLLHLVRNAVDHGIELPGRARRGRQAGRGARCASGPSTRAGGCRSRCPTTAGASTPTGWSSGPSPPATAHREGRGPDRSDSAWS